MNTRNPDDNTEWEAAMSRDFDARVRHLHEAPLDLGSVKGKARTIRRNRRAAVAGGVLGIAAVITPIAVLAGNGSPQTEEPDFAPNPSQSATDPVAAGPDYLLDGVWHQADGDEVALPGQPQDYDAAVLWGDRLVATRLDGEVFSAADVIAPDGTIVNTLSVAGDVAVNDAGTTIAWVEPDGTVMTAWDGGEVSVGSVDLAASGETIAWSAAAVTGGPDCNEAADGCTVFLNNGLNGAPTALSSHGSDENPVAEALEYADATDDGVVSIITAHNEDTSVCSGIADLDGGRVRETCDFLVDRFSPDGRLVAAVGSYQSGTGPTSISVLDATTLEETPARYGVEGGYVGSWAWGADGRLFFDAYDGARWHLFALSMDGAVEELGDPVRGEAFGPSPIVFVQR
jgi:hypothetical protein